MIIDLTQTLLDAGTDIADIFMLEQQIFSKQKNGTEVKRWPRDSVMEKQRDWNNFVIGDILDAWHSIQKEWRLCPIIGINKNKIQVAFEYDSIQSIQAFEKTSDQIAPPGTKSATVEIGNQTLNSFQS